MPDTLLQVVETTTTIETTEVAFELADEASAPVVIETPVAQGPPGPGATISPDPDNRLKQRPNGLHVSDDLIPDPLAYYILAKG